MQTRSTRFSPKDGFRPGYALALTVLVLAACIAIAKGVAARSEKLIGSISGGIDLPICRRDGVIMPGEDPHQPGRLTIFYILEQYSWGRAADEGRPTLRYLNQFDAAAILRGSSVSPSEIAPLLAEARICAESSADRHLILAFSLQQEGASRRDWRATLTNAWHQLLPMWLAILAALGAAVARLTVLTDGAIGARRLQRVLCPRCKYDMSGIFARQCPECGASW